ncbi:DUF6776 family protein [Luteimonas arsenica]|uniref:DUF6776 family protein n=1 Tax=Luteimonas arsenica TaxID=1586242 RepID=UPI001056DD70|nr:DUF6776 family protein [Luteimonas arsenica]
MALMAVLAACLLFGVWGAWTVAGGGPARDDGAMRGEIEGLRQQVATLSRSDQVSREANGDLQLTLAERDEEISALRADVAFYERLVGSTSQRRGLTVHGLRLQSQGEGAWHFTATLTQTLNRAAVSSGTLTVEVEGSRNDSLERLAWNDLRQSEDAPGVEYSFKYFQQVDGDLMLPADFKPLRVIVRLAQPRGPVVEESFTWADATAATPRSAPDA